ncbi:hypothetical protein CFBP5875_21230 [Agrobacterium pusense]|uniref:hypothetical protein n=1 Tax=Agrobacterium pusense TaxID=648995 RepID=UPI000DB314F9|nr:hypothetical protein [Agrobacterium pusense]MDH0116160.1 hypothetical protein [Agrobacterium pusense]PZU66856.1 MAG: hypothetical protein DI546_22455 [Rhizobium sp.]QCL87082.1 hypothetical protein CFBP5875_21230 [Agrobacterium pusense]
MLCIDPREEIERNLTCRVALGKRAGADTQLFTKLSQGGFMSLRLSAHEPMMAVLGKMYIVRRAGKFFDVGKVLL